jgi:3-oxoacyl-[acyl-carrier-protein] synthase II
MRRVAVTGFGVVSPNGIGRENYWDALQQGQSGIGRISRFDCRTFQVQLAGEIKEPLPLPAEIQQLSSDDPKIGYGFAACSEALADAGIKKLDSQCLLHLGVSLENFHLEKIVVAGSIDFAAAVNRQMQKDELPFQSPLNTGAQTIEQHFGRAGYTLTNCSACAAGAQAIGHAFHSIRSGRFDTAVCGGFDSMINPLGIGGFQLLGALTTDNERGASACRPFDASRNGTVLGEGAAILVLEPLDKARAAGKRIYAEIVGCGSSLDAYGLSAPDPQGDGALRAMRSALEDAGIPAEQIGHINAHGTGTALNDEIEASAIRTLFAGSWPRVPVSATKSITGHLVAAAGAIEAGACLFALTRDILPHNPWLEKIGNGCELHHVTSPNTPFHDEFALSNSFGFGGQNTTLVFRRHNG